MTVPTIHDSPKGVGWVEVIVGCMFSGKTEELIRRIRRAEIARQRVAIFKPKIDTRFSPDQIASPSADKNTATNLQVGQRIIAAAGNRPGAGLNDFAALDKVGHEQLAGEGKRVIVAGLDQDYRGQPFEPMPYLLAVAEYITKTLAICVVCGNPADRTQRKTAGAERVIVGASEVYEARCRRCFEPPVS
jgi:thymidine kinase